MDVFSAHADYWLKKQGVPSSLLSVINPYVDLNLTVLDMGCGGGRIAASLIPNFRSVYGVDVSDLIHKTASKNPEIHFVCGDFLCPKTWKSFGVRFDLIISNCAIRKTAELEQLSGLCFQYLNPGGGIAFRIQGINDLAEILPASMRQSTLYNQEEIREGFSIFSNLSIVVEQYHQRFSSEEYLRNFLKKIDIPFDGPINRLTPTRHYYIVTGERI